MQARAALKPSENIDAVMNRFQAWSHSQDGIPANDGVREISHEEAVGQSRYRRNRAGNSMPSGPAKPKTNTASIDETTLVSSAPAPEKTQRAVTSSAEAKTSTASQPGAIARKKERPKLASQFHEALASAIQPHRTAVREERQVSMSVRVTSSEQAIIKLHAAAAGLSVSAYMRQCAFDVEILRAQVDQFVAAAARSRLAELSPSLQAPLPVRNDGWFARWQRRFRGDRTTQLSLKA